MRKIKIVSVGKLRDDYLREAFSVYEKRLSAFCEFRSLEAAEYKLSQNPSEKDIEKALIAEGERILELCGKSKIYALCIEGREYSSEDFSGFFSGADGDIAFVIGSSFGLSEKVKAASSAKLSMSRMTFPHGLARVMLAEQIYRGFNIAAGGKYHK